jgi:hypothetical protein
LHALPDAGTLRAPRGRCCMRPGRAGASPSWPASAAARLSMRTCAPILACLVVPVTCYVPCDAGYCPPPGVGAQCFSMLRKCGLMRLSIVADCTRRPRSWQRGRSGAGAMRRSTASRSGRSVGIPAVAEFRTSFRPVMHAERNSPDCGAPGACRSSRSTTRSAAAAQGTNFCRWVRATRCMHGLPCTAHEERMDCCKLTSAWLVDC